MVVAVAVTVVAAIESMVVWQGLCCFVLLLLLLCGYVYVVIYVVIAVSVEWLYLCVCKRIAWSLQMWKIGCEGGSNLACR